MVRTTTARAKVSPFGLPRRLSPSLARVLAYWEGLKRGAAEIPFWDDVQLTSLPDLADRLAVIEVFEGPERFRFNIVGGRIASTQPAEVAGKFLDEVDLEAPLDFLRAQCSATVESAKPTHAATGPKGAAAVGSNRGRLVLPLWGEGEIRMLLLAVD